MPVTKKGTIIGPDKEDPEYIDYDEFREDVPYPGTGSKSSGIWVPSRPKVIIGQPDAAERARRQAIAEEEERLKEQYTRGYGPSICGTSILIGGIISCLSVVYFISCL